MIISLDIEIYLESFAKRKQGRHFGAASNGREKAHLCVIVSSLGGQSSNYALLIGLSYSSGGVLSFFF